MDMRTQLEYGLEGAFKVDIFDKDGKLLETTDYFSNFITQTGLLYPLTYGFADCFRFLSIGSSSSANTLNTTGLVSPITTIQTNGSPSVQDGRYLNKNAYHGGLDGACGTIIARSGPIMYRGWNIPSGGALTTAAVNINEFMVSPSSGTDPSGKYAFSRVVKSVTIPANTRSIISYQLQIKILNTGITHFYSGAFKTGNANVENDLSIVKEWETLSGYYRQVYHGLRCVDVEGATFVPKYGDGMEPGKRDLSLIKIYFSPDNSQFDVSKSGGSQSNETKAYAADGLYQLSVGHNLRQTAGLSESEFYNNFNLTPSDIPDDADPNALKVDIRLNGVAVPKTSNYTQSVAGINYNNTVYDYLTRETPISIATQGATGIDDSVIDLGNRRVMSSLTINIPFNYSALTTGRKKTLTRKLFFPPVNNLGKNSRFGAFVCAFKNGNTYWPMVDCLLYDNSGRALMQHYRSIDGAHLTERGTGVIDGYFHSAPVGSGNFLVRFVNGPGSGAFNHILFSGISGNPAYGIFASGVNIGTGVYGSTGTAFSGYSNGWGAVYGHERFSGVEYGIVDHSLTANTPPSRSGVLYWPTIQGGKSQMGFAVSGLKYLKTGIGVISDPEFYFNSSRQMVNNIVFAPIASGTLAPTGLDWFLNTVDSPLSFTGNSEPIIYNGYFLTNTRYTGTKEATENLNEDNFINEISSDVFVSGKISGYIYPLTGFTGTIEGLTITSGFPTTYYPFTVNTGLLNVTYVSGFSEVSRNVIRVNSLFASVTERLSGLGFNASSGERFGVFFSGAYGTGVPIYLSYMSGAQAEGYNWHAHSYLTGSVNMTDFLAPTGVLLHSEAFRLLPNHGYPQMGENYPVNFGGTYPALSFDNTLEMYMDLIWSANCAGVAGCIDP